MDLSTSIAPVARASASVQVLPRILMLDADSRRLDELVKSFADEGMLATGITSPDSLSDEVKQLAPDLVLLGLQAHRKVAIDVCAQLRSDGHQVPVIILSPTWNEVDCVLGLETGADDVLAQPFTARELLARSRAVMRRARKPVDAPAPTRNQVVVGRSVFDPDARTLARGTELRVLTRIEYSILNELLSHPSQAISRQRLLQVAHDGGKLPLPRSIDTAVMRLRRLVEAVPSAPVHLQTLHGQGYVFLPQGLRGV